MAKSVFVGDAPPRRERSLVVRCFDIRRSSLAVAVDGSRDDEGDDEEDDESDEGDEGDDGDDEEEDAAEEDDDGALSCSFMLSSFSAPSLRKPEQATARYAYDAVRRCCLCRGFLMLLLFGGCSVTVL